MTLGGRKSSVDAPGHDYEIEGVPRGDAVRRRLLGERYVGRSRRARRLSARITSEKPQLLLVWQLPRNISSEATHVYAAQRADHKLKPGLPLPHPTPAAVKRTLTTVGSGSVSPFRLPWANPCCLATYASSMRTCRPSAARAASIRGSLVGWCGSRMRRASFSSKCKRRASSELLIPASRTAR